MTILLIDTCGATGSVAFAGTAGIVATATLPGRTASERLVPVIRDLAIRAGSTLQSLDAIAVVNGPGSFTGVRVGLAAAKGLCHALDLPLIAISRLAVLAHLADPPAGSRVQALIDAGRGEFYHGEYLNGTCVRESLLTRDQLLAVLSLEPAPIVIACEPAIAESLGALSKFGLGGEATPRFLPEPTAADALPLALRRVHQQDFDDPATLDANYLRRTDAEIFAKPIAGHTPHSARDAPAMTTPRIQLRPAVAQDLNAILDIELASETAPHWPHAAYAAILDPDPSQSAAILRCLIVAYDGELPAGFAVGRMHPAEGIAELESVVVTVSVRRAGIGRALCAAVFDWCSSQGASEIILEVRTNSTAAIALYIGLGFTKTGRRPLYYRDPDDDALLMRLPLDHRAISPLAPASAPA